MLSILIIFLILFLILFYIVFFKKSVIQFQPLSKCNKMKCIQPYKPICGSDGTTYNNRCEFGQVSCKEPNLKIVKEGTCDGDSATRLNYCNSKSCPKNYNPVCGSNGKKYSNKCLYDQAVCKEPALQIVKCK